MTSPIVIIPKWVSPRKNFNLIFPSSTSVRIKNVCTQTVKLWNTAKLEDKDKPSWYWNQFWFLAREIPNLWFQYSCLIFFRSGTIHLLGYPVPLKTSTLPDLCFPSILLFLSQIAKGNASFKYWERVHGPSRDRTYEEAPL